MAAENTTKAHDECKGDRYAPSERAALLARVFDREARLPWEPIPGEVTDKELELARNVLVLVLDAVQSGDREVLDAMRGGLELRPRSLEQQKAEYLGQVQHMVALVEERDPMGQREQRSRDPSRGIPDVPPGHKPMYESFVARVAMRCDSAFARLELNVLRERLRLARPTQIPKLAAELAVSVRAWGYGASRGVSKADALKSAARDLRSCATKAKARRGK